MAARKVSRKKAGAKKTATKKAGTVKKKSTVKKKVASKKVVAKKKAAVKKATTKKKVVAKKKVVTKKKAATTKKKSVAKKKAAVKKKVATKKKSVTKKPVVKKKTTAKTATTKKAVAKTGKKAATKAASASKKPAKKAVKKKGVMATQAANIVLTKTALPVDGIEPYKAKKNEEYMNERQLEHFRNILLTWKTTLMEEVDRTVDHMKEEASNFSDPADRATQEEEFTLELRNRDRERKLIRKIDKTIARVDADDYGFCDACGVEIGLQRLEVRPTAELCIDCKTTEEIKEKQLA